MDIYIAQYNAISRYSLHNGEIIEENITAEPEYETVLDPRSMRRLSKILKMGLYTSLLAIRNIKIDGIICATSLGCTYDTYAFLNNLVERKENLLTPTPFIQSTHNTLAGTLGIITGNHGYNMTWSNRIFSFFDALEDAISRIMLKKGNTFLVTAADEMPENIASIIQMMPFSTTANLKGEGSSSFVLSNTYSPGSLQILSTEIMPISMLDNHLSQLSSSTHIINTHPTYKCSSAPNHHDLIHTTRSMIDDAFGLCIACQYADFLKQDTDIPIEIVCLSGDNENASVIQLKK